MKHQHHRSYRITLLQNHLLTESHSYRITFIQNQSHRSYNISISLSVLLNMGLFKSKTKEPVLTYPKVADPKTALKIEYDKSPLEIMTEAAKNEPRARFWSSKRTGAEGWTVFAGKSNAPAPVFVPSLSVKVPKRSRGGSTSYSSYVSSGGGGDGGGSGGSCGSGGGDGGGGGSSSC